MISIIVPVYNGELYIERCIESILNQTYRDIEIIIINDGSTDNTIEICQNYLNKDKRIVLINQKNKGVSSARNKGLELATGSEITFVDADDFIKQDYLEVLKAEMDVNNVDIVCCNSVDEKKSDIEIYIDKNNIINNPLDHMEAYFLKKRYAYCVWGKLFKSNLLKNNRFNDFKYSEDVLFIHQLLCTNINVKLIKYYGYYYSNNIMGAMNADNKVKQSLDLLKVTLKLLKLYDNIIINKRIGNEIVQEDFGLLYNYIKQNSSNNKEIYDLIELSRLYLKTSEMNLKKIILILYIKFPKLIFRLLYINYFLLNKKEKK